MTTQANADQAEFWNGPGGETWTTQRDRFNAMLRPIGHAAIAVAQPQAGEHVVDVGCGTGDTTGDLARHVTPGGSVTGFDISETMLATAREIADDHAVPVQFHAADAQTHAFDEAAYDLVFSRFGVMFFEDSVAAFANLRRALKPGGRLTFACWQEVGRNGWVHIARDVVARHVELPPPEDPRAPGPFAFGEADYVRNVVADAGFADVAIEEHATTVLTGRTLDGAIETVTDRGPMSRAIHDASEAVQATIRAELHEALRPHMQDDGVRLGAGVWLVTARR